MILDFPAGRIGAALMLMRIYAAATTILWVAQCGWINLWLCAMAGVLGACIFLGVLARVAAILLCLFNFALVLKGVLAPAESLQTLVLSAIAIAGPGALSMDSWIFGRQVIRMRL